MASSRYLPDHQLVAIAWADDTVSAVELAKMLGLPWERVRKVRRRIKRAGHWSCPLIWSVCPVCDEALASGPRPHRRIMHPRCAKQREAERRTRHPGRRREQQARARAKRRVAFQALPAEERAARLAALTADNQRDHARTLPHVTQTGRPWSEADDALLIARAGDPDREVAIALGRTLWAVRTRKMRLRDRGLLPPVASPLDPRTVRH